MSIKFKINVYRQINILVFFVMFILYSYVYCQNEMHSEFLSFYKLLVQNQQNNMKSLEKLNQKSIVTTFVNDSLGFKISVPSGWNIEVITNNSKMFTISVKNSKYNSYLQYNGLKCNSQLEASLMCSESFGWNIGAAVNVGTSAPQVYFYNDTTYASTGDNIGRTLFCAYDWNTGYSVKTICYIQSLHNVHISAMVGGPIGEFAFFPNDEFWEVLISGQLSVPVESALTPAEPFSLHKDNVKLNQSNYITLDLLGRLYKANSNKFSANGIKIEKSNRNLPDIKVFFNKN